MTLKKFLAEIDIVDVHEDIVQLPSGRPADRANGSHSPLRSGIMGSKKSYE